MISYLVISYPILSYLIISYPIIFYHIILYHILLYHILYYHIISYIGHPILSAGPSTPIRITGIKEVPSAGQELICLESEHHARNIAYRRKRILELRQLNAMIASPSSSIVISHDMKLAIG